MKNSDRSDAETSHSRWLSLLLAVVAAFGLAGLPLGLLTVADGNPILGLLVYAAGSLLMAIAAFGWVVEFVTGIPKHAESDSL